MACPMAKALGRARGAYKDFSLCHTWKPFLSPLRERAAWRAGPRGYEDKMLQELRAQLLHIRCQASQIFCKFHVVHILNEFTILGVTKDQPVEKLLTPQAVTHRVIHLEDIWCSKSFGSISKPWRSLTTRLESLNHWGCSCGQLCSCIATLHDLGEEVIGLLGILSSGFHVEHQENKSFQLSPWNSISAANCRAISFWPDLGPSGFLIASSPFSHASSMHRRPEKSRCKLQTL